MAQSHVSRIWKVFGILTVLTFIEVLLGIYRPHVLVETDIFGLHLLNWIFIVLTLVKAYFISWYFMHMSDEKAGLKWSVVLPLAILIPYLVFIVLVEGNYIHGVMEAGYLKWDY